MYDLLYRIFCILLSSAERMMTMFTIRHVHGHIQVYDFAGKFLFSADSEREAREEMMEYAKPEA